LHKTGSNIVRLSEQPFFELKFKTPSRTVRIFIAKKAIFMLKSKKMEKFYHRKLIRDKIPEIIEANNGKYELRVMEEDEFKKGLKKKLIEEVKEVIEAEKSELGSIAESENINFELIEEKQEQRRKERGGFKKKLFLIWSDKTAGK